MCPVRPACELNPKPSASIATSLTSALQPAGLLKIFKIKNEIDTVVSAQNKIKILPRKTRPTKDLKRPKGGTGGGKGEIVFMYRNCLRVWSATFFRHPAYVFESI